MRSDAFSGGRWGAVRSVVLQVTSLGTTAVLTRILSQEEYGVVAITVVVLTMFDLITRVGFGATVVRRQDLDQRSLSTFFWASVFLGTLAGLVAVLVSTPAATLAGARSAGPLVALAALTLPINLAGKVPAGLLSRGLRFRTLASIDIAGSVTHAVVAIALAFAGLGAAAVVIGQISRSLMIVGGVVFASRFKPTFQFDGGVVKEELSFNAGWLGSDLVAYANKNADYWFVGNTLGTGPLGVYYVAYVIPTLLRRRVTSIGHEITYPIVSRIQDDTRRIKSAYLRVLKLVTFLVVPAMLGLAVVADLAVQIGFGNEWTEAIDPLRVISVAAAVTSIGVVANPIFPAMGRPGILVTTGLGVLVVLGVGLGLSVSVGTLEAVAVAVLVAATVEMVVTLIRLRRLIGIGVREFASAILPIVVSSVAMAASVWALRTYAIGDLGVIVQAIASAGVGVGVYLVFGRVFFKDIFAEQWAAVGDLVIPSRSRRQ